MPSGQMVSIEVWSNPNWIQQWDKPSSRWKRECVLRSEARHGQAGGLKFQLFFVFWFVCVFFAVSRSCLKQMKVLEERLMYLFIVFCKELLCVSIPFWLKDFHLCVYIFRFPPSLTLFSILYQYCIKGSISLFHPVSLIAAPKFVSSIKPLCSWFFTVRCTSKPSDVMSRSVLWLHLWQCTIVHRWCHLTRMGCWCHLVKWFRLKYGRIQTGSNSGTNHPADEKGSAFWDRKRDMVKREDWSFSCFLFFGLFAFSLRFLDLVSNKWKSLKNV